MSWRTAALAYLLAIIVSLANFVYPYFEDAALFAAIGHWMGEGYLPYLDLLDQKPPAIHWAAAMVDLLAGHSSIAGRMVETGVILLLAGACSRIAGALYGDRARPVAVVVTALLASVLYWRLPERGQVEWYMNAALAWGVALLAAGDQRDTRRALGAGACMGLACWFKPVAAVMAIAIVVAYLSSPLLARRWRTAVRGAALIGAGVALASLPFVIWLLRHGIADEFMHTMTVVNADYLTRAPAVSPGRVLRALADWRGVDAVVLRVTVALAVVGIVGVARRSSDWPGGRVLACWAVAAVVAYGLGHFLFYYHRIVLLPPIAVLVAVGAATVWDSVELLDRVNVRAGIRRAARVGLLGLAFLVVLGDFRYRRDVRMVYAVVSGEVSLDEVYRAYGVEGRYYHYMHQREVAQFVRERTGERDRVQLLGRGGVFWLHVDRRPATRFLVTNMAFFDARLRDELVAELERRPPAMLLVRTDDAMPWFGAPASATWTAEEPRLLALLQREYELLTYHSQRILIYRHRTTAAAP